MSALPNFFFTIPEMYIHLRTTKIIVFSWLSSPN